MTRPRGRPPEENPRRHIISLRTTEAEHAKIEKCADLLGVTKSKALLMGIDELEKQLKKK